MCSDLWSLRVTAADDDKSMEKVDLPQSYFLPQTACLPPPPPPHAFSPTTHLSLLACPCPAKTRADRLILALRPSELSRLASFSPLSGSMSSNTLPGCRYGHRRAWWYVWPLCVRNYSAACIWIMASLKSTQICQLLYIQAHPRQADVQYWRYWKNDWYCFILNSVMWYNQRLQQHNVLLD